MTIPAVCIAGWANAGKTTLIEQLLPALSAQGVRVAVVKHSHHPLQMDKPGADTDRYRRAGAAQVVLAASDGTARLDSATPPLQAILAQTQDADLILVEGFDKEAVLPTLEVRRDPAAPLRAKPELCRAVVTDLNDSFGLPHFSPADTAAIAAFILRLVQVQRPAVTLLLGSKAVTLAPEEEKALTAMLSEALARLGLDPGTDRVALTCGPLPLR